jgi:hypothetical protein
MNCHYYIWIYTRITSTAVDGTVEHYDECEERQCRYCINGHPDFNAFAARELPEEIVAYGKKTLYHNGIWKYQDFGKEYVRRICEREKIPFETLVEVYKAMNGEWC